MDDKFIKTQFGLAINIVRIAQGLDIKVSELFYEMENEK